MTNRERFLANDRFSLKHTQKPFSIKTGVYSNLEDQFIIWHFQENGESVHRDGRFTLYKSFIEVSTTLLDKTFEYKIYFNRMVFDDLKYHYHFETKSKPTL